LPPLDEAIVFESMADTRFEPGLAISQTRDIVSAATQGTPAPTALIEGDAELSASVHTQ